MEQSLAMSLAQAGIISFGKFTLKSGEQSPIYIDLRRLVSHPLLLRQVAKLLHEKIHSLSFDRIAAIPYAAIPIATALSMESGRPMIYTRKEAKNYGMKKMIEGEYHPGETVLVMDDLITTGLSKLEAIQPIMEAGLKVNDIIVIIDRQQGGKEEMQKHGFKLHSLFTIQELLNALHATQKISTQQKQIVEEYLARKTV